MNFLFSKTKDTTTPAIARLAKLANKPEVILRAMGTTFMSITMGNFSSLGAQYRPSPWKPKRDGSPSNLQKSTTLSKSFRLEVTSMQAKLSTPTKYGAIHQFGGTIEAKGKALRWEANGKVYFFKRVTIPARPFFPVDRGGKLTPMAEEKILAAGQRMIDKQATG